MTVVDTSVWIDLLRATGSREERRLAELVERGAAVALTDLIYCEILQGVRGDADYARTRRAMRRFPILRLTRIGTFEHAAALYRACRRRGLTVRRTSDCLIGALCIEEGAEILHRDRDFDAIARVAPLRIHRVAAAP